jgi:hypothetical protein
MIALCAKVQELERDLAEANAIQCAEKKILIDEIAAHTALCPNGGSASVLRIGPKRRHFQVPAGYRHVTEGEVKPGDVFVGVHTLKIESTDSEDWGESATYYDALLRRVPNVPRETQRGPSHDQR